MNGLMQMLALVVPLVILLLVVFLIIAKLYKRASKEIAFVRTGAGGPKVIKDGGALVFPVFHESTLVNMNTIKLEVGRKEEQALITLDRMRVDVGAEFFVRVRQEEASIAIAAQTLGNKTMEPQNLKALIEGKFVDALRSVASSMTMKQLHEQRIDFVNKVQVAVTSDLEKNGLELESVSLTSFDQTNKKFFNPENAFDAEGLTLLTQEIEQRKKIRNDIEQDTRLQIAQKNLQNEREQAAIVKETEFVRLANNREVAIRQAEQATEIAKVEANQMQEAEIAKVEAENKTEQAKIDKNKKVQTANILAQQQIEQANIEKNRALREAAIRQEEALSLAEQDKLIVLAKKSEEEAAAKASAEKARASQVQATQEVSTIEAVATAERQQKIQIIEAEGLAKKESVKIVVAADAEAQAAEKRAEAMRIEANAQTEADIARAKGVLAQYEAEAEGKTKLNEAANKQSPEVIALQIKLKLLEQLPAIIRESVKPMEKIDSIKIVDMGNGNFSKSVNGEVEEGSNGNASGSLPDQVVTAALRHKMAAPLVDQLLRDVGIDASNINSTVKDLMK